jgi:hypothetical protein
VIIGESAPRSESSRIGDSDHGGCCSSTPIKIVVRALGERFLGDQQGGGAFLQGGAQISHARATLARNARVFEHAAHELGVAPGRGENQHARVGRVHGRLQHYA